MRKLSEEVFETRDRENRYLGFKVFEVNGGSGTVPLSVLSVEQRSEKRNVLVAGNKAAAGGSSGFYSINFVSPNEMDRGGLLCGSG
ncbi:hypothetical protein Ddye_011924 [Dipteronia dyeriana]|uniref:Uncharacterized protein n=1 Tax=Dipteronia dyeriana TaxID=168575 RepID=A0AAD9X3C2_9ROSI|nr:hypothetical protein Ddye_011924 [Dipteronia dyeriana]